MDGCALIREAIPDLDEQIAAFEGGCVPLDAALREVIREQVEQDSRAIGVAVADGRWEEVARAAHSLKGMGGTVGFPELSVLGRAIEEAARAAAAERCADLAATLDRWRVALFP